MVRIVRSDSESLLQVEKGRALAWFGEWLFELLEGWRFRLESFRFGPLLFGRRRSVLPRGMEVGVELDPFPSLLVRFPNRTYPLRLTLDVWGRDVYRAREWTAFLAPRDLSYEVVFWTVAMVWMLRDREPPSWMGGELLPSDLASYTLSLLSLREDYFLREKGDRGEEREVEGVSVAFSSPDTVLTNLLFSSYPDGVFTPFPDLDRALLATVQFLESSWRAWGKDAAWTDTGKAFLVFEPHGVGKERLEPVLRDLFFPERGVEVTVPAVRSLLLRRREKGWEVRLFSSFAPLRTRKGSYPWVRSQWLLAPPVGPERVRGLEAMTVLASGE